MWPASKPVYWVSCLVFFAICLLFLAGHVPEWCREAFRHLGKKKKNGIRIRTGLSLVNTTSEKLKLATPRASIRQWDYGAK